MTCLSTMYKILTSERTFSFLDASDITPAEQKYFRKGSYGCMDQLAINKVLLEKGCSNHRVLSATWTDITEKFLTGSHTHRS